MIRKRQDQHYGLRRLRPKIRFESCNASDVYMGAPAGGNSRAHAPPRYGRIWPRRHRRGTCITPERLTERRMGDVVNFRRARKKAERQLAERTASANRLRHGRSQAERELETKRDTKARRDLDRHRIETGDER